MTPISFLWNQPAETLSEFDGYIIVGGFSYEDRSRAGIIAAQQPIIKALHNQAAANKPILGICNGAQILLEAGLVPYQNTLAGSLSNNLYFNGDHIEPLGFYNDWVHLTLLKQQPYHAFLNQAKPKHAYHMPMANAQGRFMFPEAILEHLDEIKSSLYYCNEQAIVDNTYPTNPNMSMHNLAAVSNTRGNVMAIMPHPERSASGQFIFDSMYEYIKNKRKYSDHTVSKPSQRLSWQTSIKPYNDVNSHQYLVKSIITDNTADSINMLLRQQNIQANITHNTYWSFNSDDESKEFQSIVHQSGEFYNQNKEKLVDFNQHTANSLNIELITQSAHMSHRIDIENTVKIRFKYKCIHHIKQGKLWELHGNKNEQNKALAYLLKHNILFNPIEHNAYFINNFSNQRIKSTLQSLQSRPSTDAFKLIAHDCFYQGKVRSLIKKTNHIKMITHDKISAFDRNIGSIAHKGALLNLQNAWWLNHTRHIIENHMVSVNHPNIMNIKPCKTIPLEIIVRGYLCGEGRTSLWPTYQKGVRSIDSQELPDNLTKYAKLATPVITPTTKSTIQDESISADNIIAQGLLTVDQWNFIKTKSLELFEFGQAVSLAHGLILVDTKYEFGFDDQNNIILIDECHTPDSSRYWLADTYLSNIQRNQSPDHLGKETLRVWLKEQFDPYSDQVCPALTDNLKHDLLLQYLEVYSRLTNSNFVTELASYQSIIQDSILDKESLSCAE